MSLTGILLHGKWFEIEHVPNPLAHVLRHCRKALDWMLIYQTDHFLPRITSGQIAGQPNVNWSTILTQYAGTDLGMRRWDLKRATFLSAFTLPQINKALVLT